MFETEKQFRNIQESLYEALSAYTIWKGILYSRDPTIVPNDIAQKYTSSQQKAATFFLVTERSCLIVFIVSVIKAFDKRSDSSSFYQIDASATKIFHDKYSATFAQLETLRHKRFAHKDTKKEPKIIPALNELDEFFKNILIFYNQLARTKNIPISLHISENPLLEDLENIFIILTKEQINNPQRYLNNLKIS